MENENIIYRAQLRAMRDLQEEARARREPFWVFFWTCLIVVSVIVGLGAAFLLPDYLESRRMRKDIEAIERFNSGYYR